MAKEKSIKSAAFNKISKHKTEINSLRTSKQPQITILAFRLSLDKLAHVFQRTEQTQKLICWQKLTLSCFTQKSQMDISMTKMETSKTHKIQCGMLLLEKLVTTRAVIAKKEFFDKLSTNKMVKMIQQRKKEELMVRVKKAFIFLNKLALRQRCNKAFRRLSENTQAYKIQDFISNTEQEWKINTEQSEVIRQKQASIKIQEYESQINVLKLGHGKLENENDELRDELEDMRTSKEHSERQ